MAKVDIQHSNLGEINEWFEQLKPYVNSHAIAQDDLRVLVAKVAATASKSRAKALTEHLINLEMDTTSVLAGLVFFAIHERELSINEIDQMSVRELLGELQRMTPADAVASSTARFQSQRLRSQLENVRKMVVALIDDPRVAVMKLAERAVTLENARHFPAEERRRIAQEIMNFYCPLASRLGIWQLKWQLEDTAFRYLQPNEYKDIASQLQGRRSEREIQIEAVKRDLIWRLEREGISAEVQGRAKHIYGIWRKMRRKNIPFDDVCDVEAVRVIVDSLSDCYAVLGVVHTSWPHISEEFDDYIANPKSNGYQSIHTAVVGPRGRTLEVQIRNREMHQISELGVCAHWAYKDEHDESLQSTKVDWLRELLHWREDLHAELDFMGMGSDDQSSSRIYVTTPQGHVVDLPDGATALDFAYQIHTEIGHRCIGANVDGKPTELNQPLKTGQLVEVLTSDDAVPKREWLDLGLGYITTHRAKDNVQSWFKSVRRDSNIHAGQLWIREEAERLGVKIDSAELAAKFGYENEEDLYIDVALGNQVVRELLLTHRRDVDTREESLELDLPLTVTKSVQSLTVFAKDRAGLLRDVANSLANMNINVVRSTTVAPEVGSEATIELQVHVHSLIEVARVIDRLRRIPQVYKVRRGALNESPE